MIRASSSLPVPPAATRPQFATELLFTLMGPMAATAIVLAGKHHASTLAMSLLSLGIFCGRPALSRQPVHVSWLAAAGFLAVCLWKICAFSGAGEPSRAIAVGYLFGAFPAALTGSLWGTWRDRNGQASALWSCLVAAGIGGLMTGAVVGIIAFVLIGTGTLDPNHLAFFAELTLLGAGSGAVCAAWMPPSAPSAS